MQLLAGTTPSRRVTTVGQGGDAASTDHSDRARLIPVRWCCRPSCESPARMPPIDQREERRTTPSKRRRHPVAKVKGNWNPEEDARLIRCVLCVLSGVHAAESSML